LDTDHIKQYVFATDKLKEIRGASSILDHLNRRVMGNLAREPAYQARRVYTNGGSGLFLIEAGRDAAEAFGQRVQEDYRAATEGGASITFAVEDVPDSVADAWNDPMPNTLELLRFRLAQAKNKPPDHLALASHPFLRPCDACGSRYAQDRDTKEGRDLRGRERRYCAVCMGKRKADEYAKGEDEASQAGLRQIIQERRRTGKVTPNDEHPFIWEKIIGTLPNGYNIPAGTTRPEDFDALGGSADGKDYLALIYADGNNMGQTMSTLGTLRDIHDLAEVIDESVYAALREAISRHLPVPNGPSPVFPFDMLLIGGDDIMIATAASAALDVACTLGATFYEETKRRGGVGYSLSVGVVLAPVKYPFGPLHDLAESTLKFAKKEGAKRQQPGARGSSPASTYGDTMLNFITVTGSTSPSFERVYASLHARDVLVRGRSSALYATLRPYTVEAMQELRSSPKFAVKGSLVDILSLAAFT
jgi:hypothetical protein